MPGNARYFRAQAGDDLPETAASGPARRRRALNFPIGIKGGEGEQSILAEKLPRFGLSHAPPGVRIGLGEGPLVAQHEPPFVLGLGPEQPIAAAVDEKVLSFAESHARGETLEHRRAHVVQHDNADLMAALAEDRRADAEDGLQRFFDPPPFDVEIEGRDVYLAVGQCDGFPEIIAFRFVLQILVRHDGGGAAVDVDADNLHAGRVEEADLVVNPFFLGENEELAFEFFPVGFGELAALRQDQDVGGEGAQIAGEAVPSQFDMARFPILQGGFLELDIDEVKGQ